ncbi:hypothetical protein GCM10010976_00470 [Bizionia arctica]|uniref:DUF748 domain-containing protein n=2 Tax=Bizionia arctica TaxID=1495645 RepID=A0A917LJP6_9FLAO|nr:hypothetical protein GCM10010976_00470 [Bizionia arctica]
MGIKSYVIKNSKELIGRQIDFDDFKLNYFTGTLKITDFKMFEPDNVTNFVSFDSLIIDTEIYRYFKNEKVLEQVYLKGLIVNTILQDSSFNFDDLIKFHTLDTDSTKIEDTEPFQYFLSNLELKNAQFIYNDRNIDNITDIEDLSFFIPFIGWNQEKKSNVDVKFNLKKGGSITSSFNVNPVDGEFDANIAVNELYLDAFYKYVVEYANINSFNGKLNSQIYISGNINEAIKSIISGKVTINDFEMTDKQDKKFLAAKNLKVALQKIDYANSTYVIDSLNINDTYTFFHLDSISNNLFEIFKLNESNQNASTTTIADRSSIDSSADKIYYAINHLNLNNGVLDYTDNLTGEEFDYHLSQIQMESDSIFSSSKWVNIYSDMLLNNRGTLNAKIGVNPQNTDNAEINITIEKFLLSDINIYSNHYMGHDILEGDFYYNTKTEITDGTITSENKLLIKSVAISSNEKGLYKLPLKFALFLLKDKNGDVNLDVPVRGDLNDPSINVGKIVWTTFKNLIVKTAARPINFLAGLVDGDPKELEEITLTYTDTIPSEKSIKQLNKLIDLENRKEGLKIEIVHFADLNLQKEAIAMAEVGSLYNIETKKDYLHDLKGFETFLFAKVESDSLSVKDAVLRWSTNQNLDSLVNDYNSKLIKNTQDYLLEKNPFTKIQVIVADPKEPEHSGSNSKFKMTYNMLDDR